MLRSVLVGLCPARSAPAKRDIFDADLDRARRKPGCALCRLVRERDESAMRHMLWEDCTDPHIGAKISQHWGFCPYHIWSLIALEHEWMGDTLGVGVVYEALLRTLRTHLHEQEQKNRSLAQALPIGPQVGSEECLFCRHARQGESWFLTRLTLRFRQAARQDDTELWAALDTTLCLMHSQRVLALCAKERLPWYRRYVARQHIPSMQQEQVRRLAELLSQNLLRQMQALDDHPQEADGVLPQIEQWLTLLAGDHKALPVLVAHDAERNGPMLPVPAAGAVPQLHHDALPTCPVCTTIQTTWLARCRAPFASEESFPPVGACCANHHWLLAMGLFLPEPCDRQVIARYSAWLREQGKRQAHALAHAQEVQSDQPARCSACANIAETSAAAIRAFLRDMQETAGDARFPQGMLCLWHWKQAHDACRQWPDAPALRRRLFDRQQQALGVLGRALDAYLARFNASKRQRGEVPDVAGSDGACPRVLAFFAGEAADLR